MSHHYVEFKDVTFRYPDGTRALNGVSFRIIHGESVGIVGANGSGKSTLLMHMNGYLMPSSGTVTIGGVLLEKGTAPEIRRRVGLVFQNPDDQLFMPTVFDDVAFGPLNLGMDEAAVRRRVDEALDKVNGFALRDKRPHRLSGGQKSAVAIAGGTKLGGILGGQSIGAVPLTANPDYFKLMLLANVLRQEESEPQMGAAPSGGVSSRKGEAKMPEEPNPVEQLLKQRTLSQLLGGGLYG